jgi:hypothetical protein
MPFPGCGRRTALATAIVVALAGSVSAAEPRLQVTSGGADPRLIELSGSVRFETSTRRLLATSLAGNIDCGSVAAPANGVLHLELDGKRYPIKTNGGAAPVSYNVTTGDIVLAVDDIAGATDCVSTNITKLDLVTYGMNGQVTARSRLAQNVRLMLPDGTNPTPAIELVLADPLDCETFGESSPGIDKMVTYANGGAPEALFGVDRYEYRLQEVNGRRELRQYAKIDASSGIPLLQCTSPGLLMGPLGAAGAAPDLVFGSSFEPSDATSDVRVELSGDTLVGTTLGFTGDDAYITVTVSNAGRADATGVKFREFVRRTTPGAIHVSKGSDAIECTPIPEIANPNPCAALPSGDGFPLRFALDRLAPGHGIRLRLHRKLVERGSAPGEKVEVGYAAFVNPAPAANAAADAALGNNSQWVNFAVS